MVVSHFDKDASILFNDGESYNISFDTEEQAIEFCTRLAQGVGTVARETFEDMCKLAGGASVN